MGERIFRRGGARRSCFLLIGSMPLVASLAPSPFAARALSLAQSPFGRSNIDGDIHSSSSLAVTPRAARWCRPSAGACSPLLSVTADLSQGFNDRTTGGSARLVTMARSAISRHVAWWRRSVLRAMAMAVLSLLVLGPSVGTSWSRSAHAVSGNYDAVSNLAADACGKPSMGRKVAKLCVVAGAVAAGVVTANRMRAFDDGDDEDGGVTGTNDAVSTGLDSKESVIPMEDSSPPPLSSLQETKDDRPILTEHSSMPKPSSPTAKKEEMGAPLSSESIEQQLQEAKKRTEREDAGALVKDLDSKIEMLRAREELAKASAERKRLQDIERAAEARKQEQVEIDAKISAFERQQRMEQERIDAIKREKAERNRRERERRLAELERGRTEQTRLERRDRGGDKAPADVERMRQQPKPEEEDRKLKEKYGGMDLEERAFNILVDLGMVDLHSDPMTLDLEEDDEDNEDENGAFM